MMLSFKSHSIEDLDCRYLGAKRIKRLYQQLKKQSNADTAARELLCRRAAFLAVFVEALEVEAVTGTKFDTGVLVQAGNSLIGVLKLLGLNNIAAEKESTLKAHLAKHYGKKLQDHRPRRKTLQAAANARPRASSNFARPRIVSGA
jgi:hypothetical protein